MASIEIGIQWISDGSDFLRQQYSRKHCWTLDGGTQIQASSSPDIVPVPLSDPSAIDPEEAFVAAISSCHMLWFLSLAAKKRLSIERYHDRAIGEMNADADGVPWISKVTLRPAIEWSEAAPTREKIEQIHELAHQQCFIARSVRSEIVIEHRYD